MERILGGVLTAFRNVLGQSTLLVLRRLLPAVRRQKPPRRSTFTVRVTSSSGTDTYSSIAAAIGSLKGPLHGGANLAVVSMFNHLKENIRNWKSVSEIDDYLQKMLRKEVYDKCGLIYGIGHAVYTISDPRALLLKEMARDLAREKGREEEFAFLELLEERAVENFMNFKGNKVNKRVCANVDFYSGFVYEMIGLPSEVFTPLFAMSPCSLCKSAPQ